MNELMCLLGRHENMKVSLMKLGLSCHLGNLLTDFDVYIMLGLIEFQWCISQVRKVKPGGAH